MLIKEYRIPLPLTVEEYRIAQLYMIAKKSREESKGTGSGVEILLNEPYNNGPGGNGQYTLKRYHIGNHLPGWLKSLLPKNSLITEEEAWNAYPYTKTRFSCPFLEKFSVEIETTYLNDNGYQDNVFNLSGSDLRNREVDLIDFVKERLPAHEYLKEEDPKLYVSQKTGRGPVTESWLDEYWNECRGKNTPLPNGKAVMCAYKLCRVEFKYWGMQSKAEKFIHDIALRKTMVRAHIQAWAWMDEWWGLTMEDIRKIEQETQEALRMTMGGDSNQDISEDEDGETAKTITAKSSSTALSSTDQTEQGNVTSESVKRPPSHPTTLMPSSHEHAESSTKPSDSQKKWRHDSKPQLHSPNQNYEALASSWRMDSIVGDSDSGQSEDDDEFFDCQENAEDSSSLAKWSSMELLNEDEADPSPLPADKQDDSIFSQTFLKRAASERGRSVDVSCPDSPLPAGHVQTCKYNTLLLVLHAGSVLDANIDTAAKKSDVLTFRGAFESVMRQHYPSMLGRIAIKLVSCPSICTDSLSILSSLNPYSFDVSPSCSDAPHVTHDSIPIGAVPVLASSANGYKETINKVIAAANKVYADFIKSPEGQGFNGQICFIGDSMGSILGYDALCRSGKADDDNLESETVTTEEAIRHLDSTKLHVSAPSRRSSAGEHGGQNRLDFEVNELFMFGSPLSLVLAYRKISEPDGKSNPIMRPGVSQVYNLFHPTDPVAARLEPLLSARFSMVPPVNIPRYQKYPLGDGQPYHLLEVVLANPQIFSENLTVATTFHARRLSEASIVSNVSGVMDTLPICTINHLVQKWWGVKRLDFALYCPEGLSNFPTNALPHLFHASYWESSDVIAFILRQLGRFDFAMSMNNDEKEMSGFSPAQPREKWIRKRTSVKLKNVTCNHRANDVIVKEGATQTLIARFMYGPLDMITLTGEKVDVHVMKDVPGGEWELMSTEVTDKTGRITYTIPENKALGFGIHPVKMVVRGDHTSVDFYLAVVPPKTECVVFSIDGSFTASVSVTGRDPKVRAGAVDIVRHWQELGYLIIYITGRPDMQQTRVLSWLSQHNFPQGLVSFADGLSTDPLGHKTAYLKNLIQEHNMIIHAAYGSSKDITVYTNIGLKPRQIYIVGRVSKKHHSLATVLSEGYAVHLSTLLCHGGSRPAQGNARMVLSPRGCFAHNSSLRRRR
nr:PREDICTED: protein retinal degeneration B isoform X2 [Bemisia tabaci]